MLSLHDIQHVPVRPDGRSSGFWVNVALPFVKHSGGMCEKQDSILGAFGEHCVVLG